MASHYVMSRVSTGYSLHKISFAHPGYFCLCLWAMSLKDLTDHYLQQKSVARKMGGQEEIKRQHAAGKLTVRERLDLLFDPHSFVEFGILGTSQATDPTMQDKKTPADGVVCGVGEIDGRMVCVIAYDFTVIAGSIGEVGERKASKMRELAQSQRLPLVWLLDSAGARIQEIASSRFAETGKMFFDQVTLSGVVPQVAALMGPCAAGTAYIAALADFVPMVKGTSSMALAGPPLVKAVIGEDISAEDLGGSKIHCEVSGVGDLEVKDDRECLKVVRQYLGFFPSHNQEKPTAKKSTSAKSDRLAAALSGDDGFAERLDDAILDIVPENPMQGYDMRRVLHMLVDEDSMLEIKPKFGQGLITSLARMGGWSVGIVASQPAFKAGVIDVDESDKAARFINLCNAFNIPLVYLQDVPGFMVGSAVEKKGIIRHGAKMLYATSAATVPKITIIIRKAYGAGYYVMAGRAFGADVVVAWPSAQISLMGAEGAVNIICRKEIQNAKDPEAKRKELVGIYQKKIALEMASGGGYIDDVIDPRDTRKVILEALAITSGKNVERPWRRNGVVPV